MAVKVNLGGSLDDAVSSLGLKTKAFTPGQYKTFNVNQIGDVPTLNMALHAGHINQQQWMQQFKQIQSKTNGPKIQTGFSAVPSSLGQALNKVIINPVENAGKAIARPVTSLATGNVGQAVHSGAQLASDVTGGTVNQLAKAVAAVPPAVRREIQNKPITDIQKKAFGTTNSGAIAKKIIGSTVGTGSLLVGGGEAKGVVTGVKDLAPSVLKNAAAGAAGNAGSQITNNPKTSVKNLIKSAAIGAGAGAALTGGAKVAEEAGSVVRAGLGKDQGIKDLITNTKAQNLASALEKAKQPVPVPRSALDNHIAPTESPPLPKSPAETSTSVRGENIPTAGQGSGIINKSATTTPTLEKTTLGKQSITPSGEDTSSAPLSVNGVNKSGQSKDITTTTPNPSKSTGSVQDVTPKLTENTEEPSPLSTSRKQSAQLSGSSKISGSALNSEQRAVEKGLVTDLGEKATYSGGSYKQEAGKAVGLVNEQPEEAMKIATGAKPGDNTIHEVAVRRAVENKALQNNDVGTLTRLAQSPQHSATSEAAQRLGSEGFNADPHSPVKAIREVTASRGKALITKGGQTADKVTESTAKDIQKTVAPKLKVSRQDWHSFIQELQCK